MLHVITRYNRIRKNPEAFTVARTVILGGKAAPGYKMAKLIIKLINDIALTIRHDPLMQGRLSVVFVPNYNVSRAMELIPAVDLSEQISTAGTEASGTSNMKMTMNGALTIGTLDGANIGIRDAVGADNFFIFGHTAEELKNLQLGHYNPWDYYHGNTELAEALDLIGSGHFSPDEQHRYHPLIDSLLIGGDPFALLADYAGYVQAQSEVDALYQDSNAWGRKAIINVAKSGYFSSDRSISEYAEKIWKVSAKRL